MNHGALPPRIRMKECTRRLQSRIRQTGTARLAAVSLVGWLVDLFCLESVIEGLDNSWTPVPSAVELSLQIFKQTQKLTFTVNKSQCSTVVLTLL